MLDLHGKRVTVAGLGHFGGQVGAAKWLVGQGAKVLVTDRADAAGLAVSLEQLEGLPIEFVFGDHRASDFTETDLVVASPAIPPHNEFLLAAGKAGIPITTEIRLFVERCPATVIGVTGTKGKSTTTALLGEMLKTCYKTWVGGNIGGSLLPNLHEIDNTNLVVLELSSYMLHYLGEMHWSPHVSLVTMIAADHVPWHGSVDAYRQAKANILRFQRPDDVAVLCATDEVSMQWAALTRAKTIRYGLEGQAPIKLTLPGAHNQLNAQGALAAAIALGVSREQAEHAISTFPGLPHRLQLIHEAKGVRYYNDSIATIPESAVAALASFPHKTVIQIVGGHDHHLPITVMCNALIENAKAVLCIGESGDQVADLLAQSSSSSGAAVYRCGDLPTAMGIARKIAVAGDIVLLSTGYKSYDQFANYEQRGLAFAELVRKL